MNAKEIGKKDWEIKQEFLKSRSMSQEEEKLIEEFWKEQEKNDDPVCEKDHHEYITSFYFSDIWEGSREIINQAILKAFRSGKLSGFEMCGNLVKNKYPMIFSDSLGGDFPSPETKIFFEGYNDAIDNLKSLIEEEKKKL